MFNSKQLCKFIKKNSSAILTGLSITGVVTTSILTGTGTAKAVKQIRKDKHFKESRTNEVYTTKDKIKSSWYYYIPAVLSGGATIFCIVSSYKLNKKQQEIITSAYIFLDQQYKQFVKKAQSIYGDDIVEKVEDEIVEEKSQDISKEYEETCLFYEENYGQIFERRFDDVLKAENILNNIIMTIGEASLVDFYDLLGLNTENVDATLCWCRDWMFDEDLTASYTISFSHRLTTTDDGLEIYIITPDIKPRADWLPF